MPLRSTRVGRSLMAEKPSNFANYAQWICNELDLSRVALRRQYERRVSEMRLAAADTDVWQALVSELPELDAQFDQAHGRRLLMPSEPPELLEKPFESAFEKAYRIDCLGNDDWPDPPGGREAWLQPSNYQAVVNDLVRTTIFVRFLDGAPFLAERLTEITREHGVVSAVEHRSDATGYYAIHLSIALETYVTGKSWESELVNFNVEIQIATMTQWVLRTLSHDLYARQRVSIPDDDQWRWQPSGEPFQTSYLGHLLHYADGMMVELGKRFATIARDRTES